MTASLELSLLVVLTIAVVLLSFVVAAMLARLIRLEGRIAGGGADIFSELVGKVIPAELRAASSGLSRVLFLAEDCLSCRQLVQRFANEPPREPTALLWRGDGIPGPVETETLKIIRKAGHAFDSLGLRITPVEVWVDSAGVISIARPYELPRGISATPLVRKVASRR